MEWLKVKWDLLVIALRIALLKRLGVDVLIERAFKEGWQMHADADYLLVHKLLNRVLTVSNTVDMNTLVNETRCWRSVDEAWVNSDAQEMFDENA
ncbi:hypothetical protein [Pseudomonas phage Almagne]|nr:hypothetical protein [Pseudomonas phage Almagne]